MKTFMLLSGLGAIAFYGVALASLAIAPFAIALILTCVFLYTAKRADYTQRVLNNHDYDYCE